MSRMKCSLVGQLVAVSWAAIGCSSSSPHTSSPVDAASPSPGGGVLDCNGDGGHDGSNCSDASVRNDGGAQSDYGQASWIDETQLGSECDSESPCPTSQACVSFRLAFPTLEKPRCVGGGACLPVQCPRGVPAVCWRVIQVSRTVAGTDQDLPSRKVVPCAVGR